MIKNSPFKAPEDSASEWLNMVWSSYCVKWGWRSFSQFTSELSSFHDFFSIFLNKFSQLQWNGPYNFFIEYFKTTSIWETWVPFVPHFVLYVCTCPCRSAYNHDSNFCNQSSVTLLWIVKRNQYIRKLMKYMSSQ